MNQANQVPSVDFIVNTFERTYRQVLAPGFISNMADDHCYPFSRRIVIVNNVKDRADAEARANSLKSLGEIAECFFVSDLLPGTLQRAGLTFADLLPNFYYSDWALTAIFLEGSDFLVQCDADVRLKEKWDWITPSLNLMASDSRIAVANPNWETESLKHEAREFQGDFGIGYGFSDQLYLVRRCEFARPIYRFRAPISLRYPMAAGGRIFEQMVDSYMRVNGRMRATLSTIRYTHGSEEGVSHTKLTGFARLMEIRNRAALFMMRASGLKHPHYHI
jgi:hypothetical protein